MALHVQMLYLNSSPTYSMRLWIIALHVQMLYLNKDITDNASKNAGSTCTNVVFK